MNFTLILGDGGGGRMWWEMDTWGGGGEDDNFEMNFFFSEKVRYESIDQTPNNCM